MNMKYLYFFAFFFCLKSYACDDVPTDSFIQERICEEQAQHPVNVSIKIPKDSLKVDVAAPNISISPEIILKKESGFGFRETFILISIILTLANWSYTILHNKKEKAQKVKDKAQEEVDKFWFKTVVTPQVIVPCLKAVDYKSNESNKSLDVLQSELIKLQTAFNTVGAVPIVENPDSMRRELTDIFDTLEDNLSHIIGLDENVKEFQLNNEDEQEVIKSTQPESEVEAYTIAQNSLLNFIAKYRLNSLEYSVTKYENK